MAPRTRGFVCLPESAPSLRRNYATKIETTDFERAMTTEPATRRSKPLSIALPNSHTGRTAVVVRGGAGGRPSDRVFRGAGRDAGRGAGEGRDGNDPRHRRRGCRSKSGTKCSSCRWICSKTALDRLRKTCTGLTPAILNTTEALESAAQGTIPSPAGAPSHRAPASVPDHGTIPARAEAPSMDPRR